jgi:hypothetical protein
LPATTGTSVETNFLNLGYQDADITSQLSRGANPGLQLYSIQEEGGSAVEDRFVTSGSRGFSGNLVDAQTISAVTKNLQGLKYDVPFGTYEGSIRIPWKDIQRSRQKGAAGLKALEDTVNDGLKQGGAEVLRLLFGAPGHAAGYGTYVATASTPYPVHAIRFADGADARNIQIGDLVSVVTTDGTSAGTVIVGTGYVLARSVEDGFIQVADFDIDITVAAQPGAWVSGTNYYVYRLGEYQDGDQTNMIVPLERYLPASAASDTFLGLNRSLDSAYSGARLTTTESMGTIGRRSKKLAAKIVGRYGEATPDTLAMHPEDFDEYEADLNGTVMRSPSAKTEDGYQSITINTAAGPLRIVSERAKNKGSAFMLTKSKLRLFSSDGKLMSFINIGGSITRLFENTNDLELRPYSYLAHCIGAPWNHGRLVTT